MNELKFILGAARFVARRLQRIAAKQYAKADAMRDQVHRLKVAADAADEMAYKAIRVSNNINTNILGD